MCLNVNGHSCAEVCSGAAGKNTSFIPLGDKGLIKPLVIIFCTYTMQETRRASAFGKTCSCTTWLCSKSIIKVAEQRKCVLCARADCTLWVLSCHSDPSTLDQAVYGSCSPPCQQVTARDVGLYRFPGLETSSSWRAGEERSQPPQTLPANCMRWFRGGVKLRSEEERTDVQRRKRTIFREPSQWTPSAEEFS